MDIFGRKATADLKLELATTRAFARSMQQKADRLAVENQGLRESGRQAEQERDQIKAAVQWHHDQDGDNRCHLDDLKLYYEVLGDGVNPYVGALPPNLDMEESCRRYRRQRGCPEIIVPLPGDMTIHQLTISLTETQAERDAALSKLAEKTADLKRLVLARKDDQDELNAAREEIGSLESENRDLKAEVVDILKESQELREKVDELEVTLDDEEAGNVDTFEAWKHQKAETERLASENRSLAKQKQAILSLAKRCHTRAKAAESERDATRHEIEMIRENCYYACVSKKDANAAVNRAAKDFGDVADHWRNQAYELKAELDAARKMIDDRGICERDVTLPLPDRLDKIIVDLRSDRHHAEMNAVELQRERDRLRGALERIHAIADDPTRALGRWLAFRTLGEIRDMASEALAIQAPAPRIGCTHCEGDSVCSKCGQVKIKDDDGATD